MKAEIKLTAYVVVGSFVGGYIAKSMKKSTLFGAFIGGLAPILAYQLSIEYNKKFNK